MFFIMFTKTYFKNDAIAGFRVASGIAGHFVTLIPLMEKPENVNSENWKKVVELENQISVIATQIEKDKLEITKDKSKINDEKTETQKLKDKILKQLAIVDNVLNDPESINKIESYDNPFSEGNFANLQRVSEYAIQLQETT